VNLYAVSVGLGATLGLWLMIVDLPPRPGRILLRMGLAVLGGALIGARAAFVLLHWAAYQADWLSALQIWEGGLELAGALPGGFAALVCLNQLLPVSTGSRTVRLAWYADRLTRLLVPLTALTLLGAGAVGAVYGPALPPPWGLPTLEATGLLQRHFPLPPVAAALVLLVGFGVERLPEKGTPPGLKSLWASLGISAVLLGVELLRADPGLRWLGLRPAAWIAAVWLIFSFSGLVLRIGRKRGVKLAHPTG
jgi:hypothetical protein